MMTTTRSFEATITLAGERTIVRVTRDDSGELHLGSSDDTSPVEELLVYDLGEDIDASTRFADELRAVGTGRAEPSSRGWNVTRVSMGPVTSSIGLDFQGGGEPLEVATRALHDVVVAFAEFLAATDA